MVYIILYVSSKNPSQYRAARAWKEDDSTLAIYINYLYHDISLDIPVYLDIM